MGTILHMLTTLIFVVHIATGTVGLVSGSIALFVRKGGRLHRLTGNVFFLSMAAMTATAFYLAIVMPNQLVNTFISVFALYLVTTGWVTVRRMPGTSGVAEKIGLAVAVILFAPFAILSFQLAAGLPPLIASAVPFKGPVTIAIYVFTIILASAVFGDVRVVLSRRIVGVERIARHLWRMCLGVGLAAGSGFTNGIARLLPGPYHVPLILFLPQFIPVVFMLFWLVRIRVSNRPLADVGSSG
jgi:uncharacterized membrane protein